MDIHTQTYKTQNNKVYVYEIQRATFFAEKGRETEQDSLQAIPSALLTPVRFIVEKISHNNKK